MENKSLIFRPQISKPFLIFWVILLICTAFVGLQFNIQSEILMPLLIGAMTAQAIQPIVLKWTKYKLEDEILILPSGFRSKPYELEELQSLEIKSNSYLQQLLGAKPPQSLQLQFKSAIPRHGRVELWSTDPKLIAELNKYAESELSDISIQFA